MGGESFRKEDGVNRGNTVGKSTEIKTEKAQWVSNVELIGGLPERETRCRGEGWRWKTEWKVRW